jgi:hypothetical protein
MIRSLHYFIACTYLYLRRGHDGSPEGHADVRLLNRAASRKQEPSMVVSWLQVGTVCFSTLIFAHLNLGMFHVNLLEKPYRKNVRRCMFVCRRKLLKPNGKIGENY